jgi:hypothetical protein
MYLWRMGRPNPVRSRRRIALISACMVSAVTLSVSVFAYGMRTGVKALEEMG